MALYGKVVETVLGGIGVAAFRTTRILGAKEFEIGVDDAGPPISSRHQVITTVATTVSSW